MYVVTLRSSRMCDIEQNAENLYPKKNTFWQPLWNLAYSYYNARNKPKFTQVIFGLFSDIPRIKIQRAIIAKQRTTCTVVYYIIRYYFSFVMISLCVHSASRLILSHVSMKLATFSRSNFALPPLCSLFILFHHSAFLVLIVILLLLLRDFHTTNHQFLFPIHIIMLLPTPVPLSYTHPYVITHTERHRGIFYRSRRLYA